MTLTNQLMGKTKDITKVKIGNGTQEFQLFTLVWEDGEIEHTLWDNLGEQVPVVEWALGVAMTNEDKKEGVIGTKVGVFHPAIGHGHFFATLIALASKYQESQF